MARNERRRLGLAVAVSILAHFTALVVLLPIYALARAFRVLVAQENDALRISLVLAILIHLALLLPIVHWILSFPEDETDDSVQVDLWNRDVASAPPDEPEKTPEEELEEYDPAEEIPEGEVVQAPPSPDRRKPVEKPRFLAEQDTRVEQETRSRIRIPGAGEATPRPELKGKGEDAQELHGGMRAEEHGVAPLPSDLERTDQGEVSAEKRAPPALTDINLEPTMSAMSSALAGTGLDNLDGVVEADNTALNTAGWEYASFFNRVKRKVEQFWHPDIEFRQRDPYGNVYGFKDRVTVLLVVLRGDGSLKKLYVMQPSGAPFLDEEAYQAVQLAAPFPNVPAGLMDKRDGLVKFTFHFIVEVGSAPVFRMRRYR